VATYTAPPQAVGHVNIGVAPALAPALVQTFQLSVAAPILIQITQGVPDGSIAIDQFATLIAQVDDDSSNGPVDWAVTCASPGACGSFSPAHSDCIAEPSPAKKCLATTIFTAPSAVPASKLTITATSTSNPAQPASQGDVE